MNLKSVATAPFRLVAKAAAMMWGGATGASWLWTPQSRFDYAREVGSGTSSSIVVAVLGWMARTFPEAPVQVIEIDAEGQRKPIVGHGMPRLLERPNPFYSGPLLQMATIMDWAADGNAYWIKRKNVYGEPVQLWWAPSWTMEPKYPEDGSVFITHYEYKPDSKTTIRLDPSEVVHFRYGMDPNNSRKGLSPLKAVLKEIFTDEEAANMTAALMRNMAIPGVVISPKDGTFKIDEPAAEQMADTFARKFGSERRGKPMITNGPVDVKVLSFSPEQMTLRDLRRVPEERVSAVFGVAAIVAGLGAGLDRATFSNMAEAREAAYEGNMIPTQRLIAADLRLQLLPDFEGEREDVGVEFDLSRVRVLQPDQDKLAERQNRMVMGGWAMVSDARRSMGLPVDPERDDIFLRPLQLMPVPAADAGNPNSEPLKEMRERMPLLAFPATNGHRLEPVPIGGE